jgi:hypothetical protein
MRKPDKGLRTPEVKRLSQQRFSTSDDAGQIGRPSTVVTGISHFERERFTELSVQGGRTQPPQLREMRCPLCGSSTEDHDMGGSPFGRVRHPPESCFYSHFGEPLGALCWLWSEGEVDSASHRSASFHTLFGKRNSLNARSFVPLQDTLPAQPTLAHLIETRFESMDPFEPPASCI